MREKAGLNTVAVVCIVGCVTTWEIMAIVTSGALEGWPCPAAYTYAVHSCYFFGLPVWMLCATYERSWSEARARAVAVWRRLWWKTFLLASLSAGCAYAWYLSLQPGMTNVPTNNTIYQSQCGFVFALSVCFLGEEVTLRKVGADLATSGFELGLGRRLPPLGTTDLAVLSISRSLTTND